MYKESEVNLDDIVKALLESELGFLLLQSDNNCKNMYDVLSEKSTYEDRIVVQGYVANDVADIGPVECNGLRKIH